MLERNEPARKKLLTLKQAAAEIEESVWWLYKRVGKKGGPPFKMRGKRYRFERAALLEWANQDQTI